MTFLHVIYPTMSKQLTDLYLRQEG